MPFTTATRYAAKLGRTTYRPIASFCGRSCLALAFLVAAVTKLSDLSYFAQRVGDFGLVDDALVTPAAWTIALCELLTGIALLLRPRIGLACAAVLLLLFISVLTYGIALGLDTECGCFGTAVHISLERQLLIDFGLLLACAIIYWNSAAHRYSSCPVADIDPQESSTDTSP